MYTHNLSNINLSFKNTVGGKAASLGELINNLKSQNIDVPNGFVINVEGFHKFMNHNNLLNFKTLENIKEKITNGSFPQELRQEIVTNYSGNYVAIRSSSVFEDSSENSFAGQYDTFLFINGIDNVLLHIKKCFASLFNETALEYCKHHGIENSLKGGIAVVIQEMVNSKVSGVAFSLDTETGFDKVVLINASYGLGEMVVSGNVTPDEYLVFKETKTLISKKLGKKEIELVFNSEEGKNITKDVLEERRNSFCLSSKNAEKLAEWVHKIEKHYGCLIDVEWALNQNDELYITQARPETIFSKNTMKLKHYKLKEKQVKNNLCEGIAVGNKISHGQIKIIKDLFESSKFNQGDVLVTDITNPNWEPLMKKASAIVTDRGGRTCHAAIVAREMNLVALVGTENATKILKDGQKVTVSCSEGETGFVYENYLEYEETCIDPESLRNEIVMLKTKIMFNIGNCDIAFKYALLPNNGVGLAREEFIINNHIGVHPMALINYESLTDIKLKNKIKNKIRGYKSPKQYFISKLCDGISKISTAFYPNDVIIRFSDFKTNEYRNLLGGYLYEPEEENPMLGWRGASRYYSENYQEAFGLECLAIKKAREELGLKNIIVMIPFCRSICELEKVYNIMEKYGLKRGQNNLKVYIMTELPSNFILAEEFAQRVDGFSIGSNDLTQTILATDRDSSLISHIYDERNPAVLEAIKQIIKVAKKYGIKVGICGQAPSDFPEFTEMLVKNQIDSISITPDALSKTLNIIKNVESNLKFNTMSHLS